MASLIILTKLADYTRQVKRISYSTFLDKVESGEVKSVHVAGQEVVGVFKNGNRFEADIIDSPQNIELLRKHNVEISASAPAVQLNFWHLLMLLGFVIVPVALWYMLRQSRNGGGSNIFSMGKSRAKMFMPSSVKVNFAAVAGAHHAKRELQDIVDFLKNPEKYKRLGAKIPRGVLLVGEPGNGKTLLAKAIAGEANCPFFSITGSDFIEVFVGVGAARVRDLFSRARRNSPCIVFIDEIDAIGRQRGSGFGGSHDEREQALNQLLTEMDGFDTDSSVIVLAATNMPEVLDKALLRPGRFDRRVDVPYPDQESREQILKIHAGSLRLDSTIDFKELAQETAGFSGADLANLVNKAAINASKNNNAAITTQDLKDAHKELLQNQNGAVPGSGAAAKGAAKAKIFMPSQVKTKFSDVAGLDEAKEELMDFVNFLKDPEHYKRLGAKVTKGVLLVGAPGNGKTLLAKAVAGEANCPFFSISGSEFVEVYVGVGASRVRDLFAQARRHNPSIVFIDEIDAVGSKRDTGPGSHEERNQTLNQLLVEMDGFESSENPVIVIASTNRPDALDPALLRSGRFDRQVHVEYPDLRTREAILNLHVKKIKLDPSVDVKKFAAATPGCSSADLANLVNEAALHASKQPEKELVTDADFEEALDKLTLGKKSKSKIMTDFEKKVTAYHEAGHTLVRMLLPELQSEPIHKVTIIPRGPTLGVTCWLPLIEKYTKTKEESIGFIKGCCGGRAAEDLVFDMVSSGAYNDFEKATDEARKMVRYLGMSDVGLAVLKECSPATSTRIDEEVQRILKDCYAHAKELLSSNRDKLEKLALALLEKETIAGSDIYELLGFEMPDHYKKVA